MDRWVEVGIRGRVSGVVDEAYRASLLLEVGLAGLVALVTARHDVCIVFG